MFSIESKVAYTIDIGLWKLCVDLGEDQDADCGCTAWSETKKDFKDDCLDLDVIANKKSARAPPMEIIYTRLLTVLSGRLPISWRESGKANISGLFSGASA